MTVQADAVWLKKADPDKKPQLSATIICKDEVEKIRGALESVRFCDEVIVVDSGSSDGTIEICLELADSVIKKSWPGYVAQQNFALSMAQGEWVLSIDADERATPELAAEIQKVLLQNPKENGFSVTRHVHYLGRWIDHGGWFPEPRIRLFRRLHGRWEGVDPHYDVKLAEGVLGQLSGEIVHFTYDDMADHVNTMNRFTTILAGEHHARGRRFSWISLIARPPMEFIKKYFLKKGFMDGPQGFFVAALSSFYVFLKIAKLWEVERVGDERPWKGREN